MLERLKTGEIKYPRVTASLFAGTLLLNACGIGKSGTLPEGAQQPKNYRYEVIIGEANATSVYLFSDTKPELIGSSPNPILKIPGPTFCPDDEGSWDGVSQGEYRDNYCQGDGFYPSYEAATESRVAIIDRSDPNNK